MRDRLAMHDWNYGFIVDGFPRNARQAEFFLESYDIDGVINLDMPDDVVHERVLSRRLCSGCGLDWNLLAHRPKVRRRLRHLPVRRSSSARTTTPRRSPSGCATTTRRPSPVIELFQRKEFVASIDATASIAEHPGRDPPAVQPASPRQLTHPSQLTAHARAL